MDPFTASAYRQLLRQLRAIALILVLVVFLGAAGYWLLGQWLGRNWPWFDCLYMTVITVTTVGYGEIMDLAPVPLARVYTMGLLVVGGGAMVTCFSLMTAMLVEGNLGAFFWRKRMQQTIDKLSGHIIVCGAGETGLHVLRELWRSQQPAVVVEQDERRMNELVGAYKELLAVTGDADSGEMLERAGIKRAAGLVAVLPTDKDNVFVTITARALNPALRIVARGVSPESEEKLRRAGANAVVTANRIGGLRIASEMIRPGAVSFLDSMIRDPKRMIRVEEVVLPAASPLAGQSLATARIHAQTGLLVVAICQPGDEAFSYNPAGAALLREGTRLIVIGEVSQVQQLRALTGAA